MRGNTGSDYSHVVCLSDPPFHLCLHRGRAGRVRALWCAYLCFPRTWNTVGAERIFDGRVNRGEMVRNVDSRAPHSPMEPESAFTNVYIYLKFIFFLFKIYFFPFKVYFFSFLKIQR